MDKISCKKCGHDQFRHMIFVLRCMKCGEINLLPKDDTTGVDFLVQRYSGDNPNNKPGTDVSFETRVVDGNNKSLN